MKTCSICQRVMNLAAFYKHITGTDGYMNRCKECVAKEQRAYYLANKKSISARNKLRYQNTRDSKLAFSKEYAKTAAGKESHRRACQQYEVAHKEKRTAQRAVGNAIRDGRMVKRACEICGTGQVHAHHDDYTKPLEVRWLCPTHHAEHHSRERAE